MPERLFRQRGILHRRLRSARSPRVWRRQSWGMSPQQVDPLSWFTGPQLTGVLGAVSIAQALLTIVLLWHQWSVPVLQLAAIPFFAVAAAITVVSVRAHRPELSLRRALVVLTIGIAGAAVSTLGAVGGTVRVELWWAPTAVALILGSFAPFCSARRMVLLATPAIVAVGALVAVTHRQEQYFWSMGETVLIAVSPIVIGLTTAVVFIVNLVGETNQLVAAQAAAATLTEMQPPAGDGHTNVSVPPNDDTDDQRIDTISRFSALSVPFLRAIADSGVVTEGDRAVAAYLSRRLRVDLVTVANMSWLERVVRESHVVVNDPSRLADRMDEFQRAALRGLLLLVMDNPVVDRDALRIELRAEPNGATAVALSLEVDLPEGRRVMLLAPYYLALRTTVDDLSWAHGRSMLFKFQIPAGPRA